MIELARCGDWVLVADGDRWTFGHQHGTGGNVLVFVLVLVGGIAAMGGVVLTFVVSPFALVGVAIGAGLLALARWWVRRRNLARTQTAVDAIVVLDLANGWLLAPDGRQLAPLSEVVFTKAFQLASSARKLECAWPRGKVTVLRGDAFGGSIEPAVDALRSRGLRV
jgi:hypothetical protein